MTPTLDERAALPPEQGVLLWSMRAWVLGLARATSMEARIQGAFAGMDAADAAPGLSGFMACVDDGGIRTIDVRRMCDPAVSADERLLLDVFRLVQDGEAAQAARVLRGMVGPSSIAAALHRAEDVASALADAGHRLAGDAQVVRTAPAPLGIALH